MARRFVAASSQGLSVTSAPLITSYPFTMSCTFKPTSAVNSFLMALAGNGGFDGYCGLVTVADGTVRLQIDDSSDGAEVVPNSGATTLTNGNWYRITGVFNSATDRRLYINTTKFTSSSSQGFPNGADGYGVGVLPYYWGSGSPSNFSDGDIADAAIWSASLTDADVAMLSAGYAANTVRPDQLVNYWPLLGKTSPEIDIVGKKDLTVTGATASNHPRIILSRAKNKSYYYASSDVTVNLTGAAITAGQGSLIPGNAKTLIGQVTTLEQGLLSLSAALSLSGQEITVSQGDLSFTFSRTLTGQAITSGQGTLTYSGGDVTVSLTGIEITTALGALLAANSVTMNGLEISSAQGSLSSAFGVSITGQSLTASTGSILAAIGLTIVGSSSTLSAGTLSPSMALTLIGQAITVSAGSVTFQDQNFTATLTGQSLSVIQGALSFVNTKSLTGQALTVDSGVLVAELSRILTGQGITSAQGALSANINLVINGQSMTIALGSLVDGNKNSVEWIIFERASSTVIATSSSNTVMAAQPSQQFIIEAMPDKVIS